MAKIRPEYTTSGQAARVIDEAGDAERAARAKLIDRIWRYYDGAQPDMLKTQPGKVNDNIKHNLTQRVVDRMVEFIGYPDWYELPGGVDLVGTEAGAPLAEQRSEDQEALDVLASDHEELMPEVFQCGIVAGHVFLKLMPGDVMTATPPAFALLDPRLVTVFTDIANPRKRLFYRLQWNVSDTAYRQDIVPADLLPEGIAAGRPAEAGWAIVDYRQKGGTVWEVVNSDWWPWPFAPIVDWRNKVRAFSYYGASDVAFAPDANDAINFLQSNTGRIIKFHAHPRTIVKGMGADGKIQDAGPDGMYSVPASADIYNLEMQSDLSSSMEFTRKKEADFFAAARVVDPMTVKERIGDLTNFGVRMLFNDMLEMTEEKRRIYGRGLAEAYRRLLVMSGRNVPVAPVTHWPDVLPVNRLEVLQAAQIELSLGMTSRQSLTPDIGRDYMVEQEQIREEQQSAGEALTELLLTAGERGALP